mgnify:CR=1 FL=1
MEHLSQESSTLCQENTHHRCECPSVVTISLLKAWYLPEEYKTMSHEAGKCPGDYLVKKYQRGDRTLWLCSCCHLSTDMLVKED